MTFSRKLTVQCFDGISKEPPPDDSLFWEMWIDSYSFEKSSVNTDYIQGIKNGTLSLNTDGYSMVNDAYYCFEGPDNYHEAALNSDDFGLRLYLLAQERSYREYNKNFNKNWHLKVSASILPIGVFLMMNCSRILWMSNSVAYCQHVNSVYYYIQGFDSCTLELLFWIFQAFRSCHIFCDFKVRFSS